MVPADGDFRLAPALLLSTALVSGCKGPPSPPAPEAKNAAGPVLIAAAADLSVAFEEMGKLFEARTGHKVTFSFGASGALASQLSEGAPFDMFAAANASFVDKAVQAGACDGGTKALYARGHLVAWTKQHLGLRTLADLQRASVKKIAIANPEHAPYGKAAREALTTAGLWPALESKIVQAENVRQALQFAQTGNADVAIVALSLVARDSTGSLLPVDPALHGSIEQTLVVCRHGKNAAGAREFAKLVESSDGQALLERYGFGGSAAQPSK
jgi:molybdate transport system substrate-binding protein